MCIRDRPPPAPPPPSPPAPLKIVPLAPPGVHSPSMQPSLPSAPSGTSTSTNSAPAIARRSSAPWPGAGSSAPSLAATSSGEVESARAISAINSRKTPPTSTAGSSTNLIRSLPSSSATAGMGWRLAPPAPALWLRALRAPSAARSAAPAWAPGPPRPLHGPGRMRSAAARTADGSATQCHHRPHCRAAASVSRCAIARAREAHAPVRSGGAARVAALASRRHSGAATSPARDAAPAACHATPGWQAVPQTLWVRWVQRHGTGFDAPRERRYRIVQPTAPTARPGSTHGKQSLTCDVSTSSHAEKGVARSAAPHERPSCAGCDGGSRRVSWHHGGLVP
eukprot:4164397-Prymnesium_polylepis.3